MNDLFPKVAAGSKSLIVVIRIIELYITILNITN